MRVAVVFESMYGATRDVAEAIAAGVAEAVPEATVSCQRVSEADPREVAGADLLVVGGPTHMRGMTTGMTRGMAVKMEQKKERDEGEVIGHGLEPDVEGEGLRQWFHGLPKASGGWAAAFDTRGEGPMVGGAAKGIAHRLHSHGYRLVSDPEGFLVGGEGQLLQGGELPRARAWAAGLVRSVAASGVRH